MHGLKPAAASRAQIYFWSTAVTSAYRPATTRTARLAGILRGHSWGIGHVHVSFEEELLSGHILYGFLG